jgi:hypothetical protein
MMQHPKRQVIFVLSTVRTWNCPSVKIIYLTLGDNLPRFFIQGSLEEAL